MEIELPDGTILEAPDDADPSAVARAYMQRNGMMPTTKTGETMQKMGMSKPRYGGFMEEAIGLGETALQMGTGAIAAPIAGWAGIAASLVPGGDDPADVVRNVQEKLTYTPRSEVGQRTSGAVGNAFAPIERFADWAGEASGGPDDVLGATAVKTAILGAPALMGLKRPARPAPTPRQQVYQTGRQHGYVATPSQVSGNSAASALEGLGGKIKTQQSASLRNQPVTNRLAAAELGLPDGTDLSAQITAQVRAGTQPVYDAMRNLGQINLGNKFNTAVDRAVRPFRSTQSQLPKLSSATRQIVDIADELKQPSLPSATVVDAIQAIRERASAAYAAGEKGMGKSYRQMAGALESALDDHLTAQGNAQLLGQFRDARQLIAKSYTVENALVGSNVNAQALAAQLKKGKPLSGALRDIAEYATEFRKDMRLLNEPVPAYSPLDAIAQAASGAAALGTGNVALAAPLIYSASRPGIRNFLLSPAGQALTKQGQAGNALYPAAVGAGNALLPLREEDLP